MIHNQEEFADIHDDADDNILGFTQQEPDWLFLAPGRGVTLAAPANLGIVYTLHSQFIQVMIPAIFNGAMGDIQFFSSSSNKEHLLKGLFEIAPQLCGFAKNCYNSIYWKTKLFEGFPKSFG